jgi:RHS repeat-associated protein
MVKFLLPIVNAEATDALGWAYFEYRFSSSTTASVSLTLPTNEWLDELRLYPADAMMTTIAYNEDGTVRTQCDENNRITTYLYDAWRRVQWTLDDQREILTFKEYHIRHIDNVADLSWTKTKVALEEGMDRMSVESAPSNSTQVHIGVEYVDGLGRPLQTIAVRQSPMMRDIVSFHQYDSFGRELKQYLPFTRPFNDGEFIPDAIARQSTFYQNTQHVAQTDFPFAEVEVEPSPLGRITRKGSPGESWSLSDGFTVSSKTVFNGTNDVLCWRKTSTGWSAMVNGAPSYYPAGALAGELTINEHGNRVWVFTNSAGQLVCTRLEALMSGSGADLYTWTHGNGGFGNIQYPGNSAPSERFIDSYVVYDEFGRTSAEIPAIAVLSCGSTLTIETSAGGINESIFSGYLTAYEYDARGRVTRKKEPGCDYSEYVYNRLNQVVLSRSPELSEDGTRWNFVKYDALGRPIQTGFYSTSLTRQALQSQMDGSTAPLWEMKNGQMQAFYSNLSFPVLNPVSELHTETYYDDYMFDVGDYEYNYIGMPEVAQTLRMRGNITGSRVMVLDGAGTNYLLSVHYSDLNGRPAVDFTSFITGGFEKQTTTYDFTGKVDRVTHYLKRDANTDALTWENWFTYDSAGRLRQTWQKTESDQNVMLSRLQYNELGQVVKKHLHQTAETDIGMQVVDYRYNERGWLTHINNADLVDDGDNLEYWDAFGEELIYEDIERYSSSLISIHKRYDGNIAGIKWKTNSALDDPLASSQMGGHSYVFRYDDFNQMTAAFYAASADQFIDNYSYRPNTWDEKVNYGLNGRILHINRKRGTDMQGNPLAQFAVMDNLSYSYVNHSNQLLQIKDQQGMVGWTSSFSHFVDLHPDGPDYAYDQEGRMTLDKNKGLTFEYNHLDLVAKAIQGTNEVQFIWDATGNKLAKVSPEGTTYYLGMAEYDDTELLHIATSEGLVRNSNGDWVYDYYLKDHLGNVRVVLTEENSTIVEEKVTVELEKRYIEDATFENVSLTEQDKPYLYPYDPYDPDNAKVSELTAQTGKIIGPAKMIQVVAGEKIDLSTQYWYTEEAGDPLTTLSEIIAGTLLNMTTASIGVMPSGTEQGMGLLNNVTSSQFNQFNTFMNQAFDGVDLSKPQAYMVYLLFKDDMTLDNAQSGVIQVGEANQLGTLSQTGIIAKKEGFFYVYVTNRSEGRVNFDNLKISRWQPQVRVAYDYYPFGLTWHNPAAADTPEGRHDHAYQDKEFQWNEFGAGAGMALYDFHARMYDPATATWSVPDPAEQFSNPYLAMGNNPVIGVDPDGRFVFTAMIAGFVIGAYVGGTMANNSYNPLEWEYNSTTLIAMGVGGVIGAFGGYSFMAAKGAGAIGAAQGMSSALGKKMFGSVIGGTLNSISNYDEKEGVNWGTLGDFGAGFGGSFVGLHTKSSFWGFLWGGSLNVASQYYQNGKKLGKYEAAQAFVGGGLSAMGGMTFGGFKSAWLNNSDQAVRIMNKFLHYGTQSIAYDFAYSKQETFMQRSFHERVAMFMSAGITATLASEAFAGKMIFQDAMVQGEDGGGIANKIRSIGLGIGFTGLDFLIGGFSKGGMSKYYGGRSQLNKGGMNGIKSLASILFYW